MAIMKERGTQFRIIRFILVIILLACFIYEILENLYKFLARKSSFDTSEQTKEMPEPLPAFSICADPPYDERYFKYGLNVSTSLFYWSYTFVSQDQAAFPQNMSSKPGPSGNDLFRHYYNSLMNPLFFQIGEDQVFNEKLLPGK